jgi:hypothetical protein
VSIRQSILTKYLSIDIRQDRGVIALDAPNSSNVIKLSEGIDYPKNTDNDYQILRFREKLLIYFMSMEYVYYIFGHFLFSEIA